MCVTKAPFAPWLRVIIVTITAVITSCLRHSEFSARIVLQNANHVSLNGEVVKLQSFDETEKEWRIRVAKVEKTFLVKADGDHLRLIIPALPQKQAIIKNVQKQPDLNNRIVNLVAYHADRGRYECSLVDGWCSSFALLPEKLCHVGTTLKPPVVRKSSPLGMTSVATRSFEPGEIVFVEDPIWHFDYADSPPLQPGGPPSVSLSFLELSMPKQVDLLSLLPIDKLRGGTDLTKAYADQPVQDDEAFLSSIEDILKEVGEPEPKQRAGEVLRFLKIMKNNSFRQGNGIQILLHHSRINHSCRPNVFAGYSRGTSAVIAIRHIEAGDELSLSYKDKVFLQSRDQRQRTLNGWFPECCCSRCQDPFDDARRFRCASDCGGHCFARWEDQSVGPCVLCSAEWSFDQTQALLKAEARLSESFSSFAGKEYPLIEIVGKGMEMVIGARVSGLSSCHSLLAELHECLTISPNQLLDKGITAVQPQLLFHHEEWQKFNAAIDAPPFPEGYSSLFKLANLARSHGKAANAVLLAMDNCRARGEALPETLKQPASGILPGVQLPSSFSEPRKVAQTAHVT